MQVNLNRKNVQNEGSPMTPRIILDCDPGHDDAVAMLLAAGNPHVEIAAITTVGGNQTLEKVTRNALGIATLAGISAPIAAGCATPLVRDLVTSPEIHGESGLDGVTLPEPAMELDRRHAVDVMIDVVCPRSRARSLLFRRGRSRILPWPCANNPRSLAA